MRSYWAVKPTGFIFVSTIGALLVGCGGDSGTSSSVRVALTPTIVNVPPSGTQSLTATVTGAADSTVLWTTTGGTVSGSGLFTAPATSGTYFVTATSLRDSSAKATSEIAVTSTTPSEFVYDFGASSVSTAWSVTTQTTSPNAIKYLGPFTTSGSTRLTLAGLTPHTTLRIEFDLYVVGSWNGQAGPNRFTITTDGITSFSETFSNTSHNFQSYPGDGVHVAGTGAVEQNILGYTFTNPPLMRDTHYHIIIRPAHNASTASIVFAGSLTATDGTQSWGLKNVRVKANP